MKQKMRRVPLPQGALAQDKFSAIDVKCNHDACVFQRIGTKTGDILICYITDDVKDGDFAHIIKRANDGAYETVTIGEILFTSTGFEVDGDYFKTGEVEIEGRIVEIQRARKHVEPKTYLRPIHSKPALASGVFEINKHGAILKFNPASARDKKRGYAGKNLFDLVDLKDFYYQTFLAGSGLQQIFELANATITFLRLNRSKAMVLCKNVAFEQAQESDHERGVMCESTRRILAELEKVEPLFSFQDGRLRMSKSNLTVSEAAKLRGVTVQAIRYLIRQDKLDTTEVAGKQFISRASLEAFVPSKRGPKGKRKAA